jgi:hypothetical protein
MKKISFQPGSGAGYMHQIFHQSTCDQVVSADKRMIHARGPVWHRKHQKPGIIPTRLTGLDTAASWSDRKSDGWVYGHGTFCRVAWKSRSLGACKWRRHSAHEAKRMWLETGKLKGLMTTGLMDSKAAEQALFVQMPRPRRILLLTTTRQGADKSPARKRMITVLTPRQQKRLYKQRSYTVEPRQGLVNDLFDLETCWMRSNANHRWLFAAMGVVVHMHQYQAWQEGRSTWAINQEVLGR